VDLGHSGVHQRHFHDRESASGTCSGCQLRGMKGAKVTKRPRSDWLPLVARVPLGNVTDLQLAVP
jgi:hypothetical protein